jgi:hypothetical protein
MQCMLGCTHQGCCELLHSQPVMGTNFLVMVRWVVCPLPCAVPSAQIPITPE